MTPNTIKPTVGRRVWFRPSAKFLANNPAMTQFNPEHPMDAGIVYVHHDHMVNLIVTDHVGKSFPATSVPLLAGQYEPDEDGDVYCCCEWMPYQKSQAAKTEAAENASAPGTEYRQTTQREQLEYALVSGAAAYLSANTHQAGHIADGIQVVLNKLHPKPVLLNPHTGAARDPRDVASDPQAILCVKPGEPIKAAPMSLPVVEPGPDSLEREIQAKANNGPRVTLKALKDEIVSEWYINGATGVVSDEFQPPVPADSPLNLLTICVLVLRNGFTVHGVSACVSQENFNAEIGRSIARENAEREIWPLLGFRLRDELARPALTDADAAADLSGAPRPNRPTV